MILFILIFYHFYFLIKECFYYNYNYFLFPLTNMKDFKNFLNFKYHKQELYLEYQNKNFFIIIYIFLIRQYPKIIYLLFNFLFLFHNQKNRLLL